MTPKISLPSFSRYFRRWKPGEAKNFSESAAVNSGQYNVTEFTPRFHAAARTIVQFVPAMPLSSVVPLTDAGLRAICPHRAVLQIRFGRYRRVQVGNARPG